MFVSADSSRPGLIGDSQPVSNWTPPPGKLEERAGVITVSFAPTVAKLVRLQIFPASPWTLISEVAFNTG